MIVEMRVYTIKRGQLQTFVREWQEKIKPFREKLGFKVEGAWTVETAN